MPPTACGCVPAPALFSTYPQKNSELYAIRVPPPPPRRGWGARAGRRIGAARRARGVGPVAVQVLNRLAHERLRCDGPASELGMSDIESSIEHGYLHSIAIPRAGGNLAGEQTPGSAQDFGGQIR